MIEDSGLAWAGMESRYRSAQYFRREEIFGHLVLLVEYPRVLNPEGKLRRSVRRDCLAIQHGTAYARAMAAGLHEVAHVSGLFAGQKTVGGRLVDGRLNKNVGFLDAAVNHADGRGIDVGSDRSHL